MKNRLGITLVLTAILSLGGVTFAKTVRTARPQNTNSNTAGGPTMSGGAHKSRKARHRKHRRARTHRKAAAAANANR